jgi:hypothetical protein
MLRLVVNSNEIRKNISTMVEPEKMLNHSLRV